MSGDGRGWDRVVVKANVATSTLLTEGQENPASPRTCHPGRRVTCNRNHGKGTRLHPRCKYNVVFCVFKR